MKAKVIETGEIVDVRSNGEKTVQHRCTKFVTADGRELLSIELNILPAIDWEQRRYEIAKAAMVGTLAFPVIEGVNPNPNATEICKLSVTLADALIEELKKESK